MTAFILCLLAGMVFAQRFRVLILVPVSGLVIALTMAGGLLEGGAFWRLAMMAVVSAASLQIGYLVGLCIRPVLTGKRANALPGRSLTPPGATRRSAL